MKAVVLLSGGLDSILAAKLILKQGIHLTGLYFSTPFQQRKKTHFKNYALLATQALGIKLKTLFLAKDLFEAVKNPRYGYGTNMNPCIDCRIIMLKKAKAFMQKIGASFIVTGEVLGQRPMSQKKTYLRAN